MRQQKYTGKALAALSVTAAVLIFSCCLGQTQARYENYAQWRGVYTPQQQVLHSDRLTPDGQKILLGDWAMESAASRMEAISIATNTGTVKGTLRCVSDHPEYISASLDRTEITVGTTGVQIQMTMTPASAALTITEQTTANLRVEFLTEGAAEPTLWADYQVTLLKAEPETVTETQETTLPEETTVPEETTLPEETQPAPVALRIESADTFAWSEQLTVNVTVPTQTDTLVLTMDGGDFPTGTRYIYDQMTYLLGMDMPIEIPVQIEDVQSLRLDFSQLSQPQSGEISLQVQSLYQQTVTGTGEMTATTTREALGVDLTQVDPVLMGSNTLSIPVCQDTNGTTWRLEMLTQTENGIVYTQPDDQSYLVITISEEMGQAHSGKFINISNISGQAPAGTYRLTLERLQDEQVISSAQMLFFICY